MNCFAKTVIKRSILDVWIIMRFATKGLSTTFAELFSYLKHNFFKISNASVSTIMKNRNLIQVSNNHAKSLCEIYSNLTIKNFQIFIDFEVNVFVVFK